MNNELLERIERLEQAIQEIWAACSCLRKDLEDDEFNCESPTCEDCGEYHCVCEPESEDIDEEPEEPEETIEEEYD
jgi:hypothetical protein